MRISVIGTGYLGAVHAAGLAALGHDVVGVDSDHQKIAELAMGIPPFYEPEFEPLLRQVTASGKLRFTTELEAAIEFAAVHFVCVGTPQLPGSFAADTTQVESVVALVGALARQGDVIVGKSTVPVGTAQRLLTRLQADRPSATTLAWNPEFLREGFAVADTLAPDRIVLGVDDHHAEAVLRQVYAPLLATGTPILVTDLATAELVKLSANSFLATKISFINAVAQVCEAAGADVAVVADAIGLDERIGRRFLNSGVGFGGGCLGKDIRAFQARAQELGVTGIGHLLGIVDSINESRRRRVVDLATARLEGTVAGRRVCVLGAAFKPNSDDVRDSPALDVACRLHSLGAIVTVHDPFAIENARRAADWLTYESALTEALANTELVIVLTEWECYRELDPYDARSMAAGRAVIDGRNCLDHERWIDAGWTVDVLGRPNRLAQRNETLEQIEEIAS